MIKEMAETQVKNQVCGACGSDVRPHSLFCYHCGGALDKVDTSNEETKDEPSDVWFRSEITPTKPVGEDAKIVEEVKPAEPEEQEEQVENDVVEENVIEEVSELEADEEIKETPEPLEMVDENSVSIEPKPFKEKSKNRNRSVRNKPGVIKGAELKSASALRKRERPTRIKKVEIVWEERDNSPNIWFVVFALILSLLVAALVIIAFYLK